MNIPRLYAIADASFGDPIELSRRLFEGGARLVQLRNKPAGARELLHQTEAILRLAPPDARVLVNDRVDVALLAGAHGVHLGQDDLSVEAARSILGSQAIIGFSTHNLTQALQADQMPVDYVAVGPIFLTRSKQNPDPVLGLEAFRAICGRVQKPVVAIGGITFDTGPEVFEAGATGIAVISDLLRDPDISGRTRRWCEGRFAR